MNDLQNFKDQLSIAATGMTTDEAHRLGVCLKCKLPWQPRTHSDAGKREYAISGYCEDCWNALFPDEG